jgi:hypothetical protein
VSQIGNDSGKKPFNYWVDYKYNSNHGYGNNYLDGGIMSKYNQTDNITTLQGLDDGARMNSGHTWRIPTAEELMALVNAVNIAWDTDYQGSGIAGLVCTDKTDSSKVLFFPSSGWAGQGSVRGSTDSCFCWSSSILEEGPDTTDPIIRARSLCCYYSE